MARVLAGLSGGVDSSVAAALLCEQGHEVVGAFMKNWVNVEGLPGACPWEADVEDAAAVARVLGIEFRVVDLVDIYRERIVDPMLAAYRDGLTPNPDVWCNREVKFGVFLEYALAQGFEAVATGHYVRRREAGGRATIWRGADPNKDQSYFLALLTREQVARARFPVGELLKPQVREVARRCGLPTAGKQDSQGICFIGEVKMSDFLAHYLPERPGEIVDLAGRVLGRHRGLHFHTIGQRRGHGVASPREGMAYVVVRKDFANNQLVLGWDEQATPGLYARRCVVGSLAGQACDFGGPLRCEAQPRYRARAERVAVEPLGDGRVAVEFGRPQRALAAGQVCAFYAGAELLGGGVFEEVSAVGGGA
jgi:tRNA-specific 2-thiouridylase